MAAFLAGLKKGALHKELGVKAGGKIPAKKLKIKKGMSGLEKKRIQFAINAKKWKKGGKKKSSLADDEKRIGVVNS